MYLKSLEIMGFKSFYNRTKIDFTKGITALVGPNGCGKSNIVDAVRWVLGELSPSLLRCEKMEDVIFLGTSDRKELGLAEVTLTVSNDDGEIPLDYSEVAITRRLYRSGESEYCINKNLCRLKDIHNLLLNTGVSHRAYSVFENVMINRVLSKDNTYKRLFFEEASKIAKYRERKAEVLRKLEVTENSMTNLSEVIAEAERYTSSLKRQASRARRYVELKEQLTLSRVAGLKVHHSELTKLIAADEKRLEKAKAEKIKTQESFKTTEKEIDEIASKTALAERSIEELERELSALDRSIGELEKDTVGCKERMRAEEARVRRAKKELDGATKAKERTAKSLSLNSAALEKTHQELKEDRARLVEIETELEKMGESDLLEAKERLSTQEATVSRDLMQTETVLQTRVVALGSLESEIRSLSEDRQVSLTLLQESSDSVSELQVEESDLKNRIAKLAEEAEICRKAIARVERQMARVSTELSVDDQPLSDLIQSNQFTLKDYFSVESRYEKAIMGALGARLMAPVIDDREDLLKIVETLKEQGISRRPLINRKFQPTTVPECPRHASALGRAMDFVQVESEARGVLEWLLSDYVVVDILASALTLAETHPGLSFSTLEGDVLQSDGTVWTGLFKKEQKDALERLRETHSSLTSQLTRIEPEQKSLMKDYSDMQMKRLRLETENSRLGPETEKLEKQIESLTSRLRNERREVTSLRRKLKEEENELSRVRGDIGDMDTTLSSATQTRQALVDERNEMLVRVSVSEERVNTIEKEMERDKEALKESEQSLSAIEEELKEGRISSEELDAKLAEAFSQLRLLIDRRNGVLETKNEAERHKKQLREKAGYLAEKRKLIQSDVDRLSETLHRIEMKLMEHTTERESLQERAKAEHGVDLSRFKQPDALEPERVEKLEDSLRRLGVVNPLAAEEYEKEKERLDFLRGQLDDLVGAKKYLFDTLALIDERATSLFKKTFTEVRRNFKSVFTRLFEGGVADLRLGDKSDVFQSPIELVANPQGKKLKSLDALSGGERALVAIAFLFSLYLCRPSPFCILDEIDAALDDANVARFLAFLRDLSPKTQFLMVTHNKRSMEAANSLYGITMEEPGVSKIVSVKFRE